MIKNLKQRLFKSALTLTAIILATFIISSCTSSDTSDPIADTTGVYDHTVKFSEYKTFALVEPPDDIDQPGNISEGVRLSVIQTLTEELKKAGLKEVSNVKDADLKATSFIKVKKVTSTVTGYWYEYYYWGWYWDYDDYWYHDDEVEFDMGTLIVDVVDSTGSDDKDDKLIFRGVSMGIIADDPHDAPDRVEEAIRKIFSFWPVN